MNDCLGRRKRANGTLFARYFVHVSDRITIDVSMFTVRLCISCYNI